MRIEFVPKLDTNSFCTKAIMRFIARRVKPSAIISENGTNFVESLKEFAEYVAAWNKQGIKPQLIHWGIRWKFNAPAAPHFGEVWERLVRSCKKAMYGVLETNQSPRTFFQQRCVLLSRRWLQSIQILLTWRRWTLITLCLATRTFAYPIYQAQKNFLIIKNSFDKLKSMKISHGTNFVKNISQLLTTCKNGDLRQTKPLRKAISFGWSKTAISADITI